MKKIKWAAIQPLTGGMFLGAEEALLKLASLHGVELPITQTVFDVIHKKITKQEAIKQLFDRTNIFEF